MAKKIYMTDADVDNVVDELRNTLTGMKCYGRINIKRTFKSDDRSAFIFFTAKAWAKMATLVARYDTEVQWHGLVRRLSDTFFEVFDIIVPPHEVTGTTVTSEYQPYSEWLNGLDDETFNAVKFHGHSHVNMPVSPSGTDEKYRLDLVTQLPKPVNGMDVFYIFMIINKSHKWSAEIYDFTNNALYSTTDISIETCLDDSECLEAFMAEAKEVAVSRVYPTYSPKYGGYYGNQRGNTGSYVKDAGQPTSVTPIAQAGACSSNPAQVSQEHSKVKKNGGEGKCCGYDTWDEYYAAVYGIEPEDDVGLQPTRQNISEQADVSDEDDPNSPFYVKEWGYT